MPVSDHRAAPAPLLIPQDMLCPADAVFDVAKVSALLHEGLTKPADNRGQRAEVVAVLTQARKTGVSQIRTAFLADPLNARGATQAYTYLTDCLVGCAYWVATEILHPLPNPTEGERLALLAVGGYGRAEMAPHSDVDLLFLTPYKITPWAESVIESMLYILWDLRLKVGYASRTIRDCVNLGREDYTIRTALLEQRFLCGDERLSDDLDATLWDQLFSGTAAEFIEAKLAERETRHEKQGGQRYVVEPNVKEGKGGLRDLQSLFWIAKYVHHVRNIAELVPLNVFRPEEYNSFYDAEYFLWAVRCHLHLITNRASDQLTFDLQVEVADRMGYSDHDGRRGVEYFMQDYFRHATTTGDLTRIFLTELEASHVKKAPDIMGLFRRRKRLKAGYKRVHNRLAITDESKFLSNKLNLLRLFEEGLRTGYLIHPDAMRLVVANLDLIDDDMRRDKEAVRIFLDLLLKHGNPERALRRMNELGVLSAFIPEFEPIVAMMQFNMYHSYTVDEHTIQCIAQLAKIEKEELVEDLPIASGILKEGVNRKVLYIALLIHDIGKGRDEDHSILGAKMSRAITPRLGLSSAECKTVEWLVRNHLLMSDMAQKRDVSDPRTVREFAKIVGSKEKLNLLTVLTVCDIRGVGPTTWNNWKAMLIRDLYRSTAEALKDGIEALNVTMREEQAKRALRDRLADMGSKAIKNELQRHYSAYWQGLRTDEHAIFARLLQDLDENEIRIDLKPDLDRDATRVCFALADHPGIFSRLAGALALVGANVVDARTYTSKDGYATPVFWIQDTEGHPYDARRLPRLQQMIDKTLKGHITARDALKSRDKIKKRERAFKVPTSITFNNEGSDIHTIIEVDTRDRPGLLYDLTRTLAAANVYIASAVVATYGEQAVDSFYVKDMFGLKFYSEAKQASLEKRLQEAIREGAKRAVS